MATSSTEDDFHQRFRKRFKVPFREAIIPSHILPYLQVLVRTEQEEVKAIESQRGPTLAADELFEFLLRRPNWENDLTTALRDPGIGHPDLADEIDEFRREISLRYTPSTITDENGTWCCNGHCGTPNIAPEADVCIPDTETIPKIALEAESISEQTGKKFPVEVTLINTTEQGESSCEPSSIVKDHEEPQTDLATRREFLKIQIMEKIWSFVEKPEDVPRAVEAGRQICLQLQGIEKGSLLFKMKVSSLDDLERLRDLVRYGGMKKILDQEVIHKNMKVFKDLAKSQKLELKSIDSQLYVHEADIYRCKSLLLSQRNDPVEKDCIADIAMPHFKDQVDIMKQKRLKELLPPFCLKLLEDPFLSSRYTKFLTLTDEANAMTRKLLPLTRNEAQTSLKWLYELEKRMKPLETQLREGPVEELLPTRSPEWLGGHYTQLIDNLKKDLHETKASDVDRKRLSVLFCEWLKKELATYFKTLSKEDLQNIVQLAAIMFLSGNHESLKDEQSKVMFTKSSSSGFFEEIPIVKPEELLQPALNQESLSHLMAIGVLTKSNEAFEFCSKLVRDTVLAQILDLNNISVKLDMSKYEFLPVTMGLFSTHGTKNKDIGSILQWRREEYNVFNLSACLVTSKGQNLFLNPPAEVNVELDRSLNRLWLFNSEQMYGDIVLEDVIHLHKRAKKTTTGITIELLDDRDFSSLTSLVSDWALNVFIMLCGVSEGKAKIDISVDLSNLKGLNTEGMMYLSQYLAMSKFTTELVMPRCAMAPEQLTEALMTGNFANIKHLNLSRTRYLHTMSDPLGLRYLPKLCSINLHDCDLRDSGVTLLAEELCLLEELKEINVSKNAISAEGLQELRFALSMNHGLVALRLQNNQLGPEGALVLSGWLRGLYVLEVLNISSCSIKDVGVKAVSMSIVSKVIRQISMRENYITENGSLEFFKNMKDNPMLEHLDYGRNLIFPKDMILHAYEEPNVEYDPNGHGITFDEFLLAKPNWDHLNLWSCNLGAHRVFKSVDKFHVLKHLVHLCMQSNMIDDEFAIDVGTCLKQHCVQIQHINLRHNRVGNAGASAIAEAVTDKLYLEELLMDRNQIAEKGIRLLLNVALAVDHSLKLDVSCNSLARPDIERLGLELKLQVIETSEEHERETESVNSYVPQDCRFAIEIKM